MTSRRNEENKTRRAPRGTGSSAEEPVIIESSSDPEESDLYETDYSESDDSEEYFEEEQSPAPPRVTQNSHTSRGVVVDLTSDRDSASELDGPTAMPTTTTTTTHSEEPQVRFFSPMPAGYVFVPKGDVYITSNCRKRTHAAGRAVYVVIDKHKKPLGLRCPGPIYEGVLQDHQATAGTRAAAVRKRDDAVQATFQEALLQLYPAVPRGEIPALVEQALEKNKRRVGRTSTISMREKVNKAVGAHIRHCHTRYDRLLKEGVDREAARREIRPTVVQLMAKWSGRAAKVEGEGKTASEGQARRKRKSTTRSHPPGRTLRLAMRGPRKQGGRGVV